MTSSPPEKSTEQELRDKYLEIAELAGGLAHEIRNPLSTISLNIGVLKEELHESESPRDLRMLRRIESIQAECVRLEAFLDEFLQFARVTEPHRQRCDLTDFVQELIQFVRLVLKGQDIEVSPHLDADLPAVSIDQAQFRRALLNLIRNAQQALPNGGVLEFQAYRAEADVVLEIIDNGQGIPETARETIFETFYSTKPGGSGLGLPTTRKIVEAHQGTIQCASEVGKGTRFRITLPACEDEPA